MAMEPFLLELLVCPESRQPLRPAAAPLLERLNAAIDRDKLKDRAGHGVRQRLHAALIREDGTVAYPVWDDIPRLLIEQGLLLEQCA
jgi:uncharacterized protein YbaR (Trm112 family)